MTVIDMWWLTLGIGAVVVAAVALLLVLILMAARRIDRHAAEIWHTGKGIARNTAAIWMLQQTNTVAKQILSGAAAIAGTAESIDRRLAALPDALARR